MPKTVLSFAFDETAYKDLILWVSRGWDVSQFPYLGEPFYMSNKLIAWVGALIASTGVEERIAARLVSFLFSIIYFIALFQTLKALNILATKNKDRKLLVIAIALIACFFPSTLIWSVMGLKEGVIFAIFQLWVLSIVFVLKGKLFLGLMLANLSCLLMVFTRLELAYILLFSIYCWLLFRGKQAFKGRPKYFIVLLIGSIAVSSYFGNELRLWESEKVIRGITTEQQPTEQQPTENEFSKEEQDNSVEEPISLKPKAKNILLDWNLGFVKKRLYNASPLEGATYSGGVCGGRQDRLAIVLDYIDNPNSSVSTQSAQVNAALCHVVDLPKQVFNYWFRPLLIVDSENTFQIMASIENTFWIFFLVLALVSTRFNSRFQKAGETSSLKRLIEIKLYIMLITFILASALYEGNMGAAYRHKSAIFPLVILLFLLILERLQEKASINSSD